MISIDLESLVTLQQTLVKIFTVFGYIAIGSIALSLILALVFIL